MNRRKMKRINQINVINEINKVTILWMLILAVLLMPGFRVWAAQPEEAQRQKVRFTIDNMHAFEGMEKAYKNGYTPTIRENQAVVILPLTADGVIQNDTIEAAIDLGKTEDSPFIYKNYHKTFQLEEQTPADGTEPVSIYYVRFDLDLQADRVNGIYPVVVDVTGKDEDGKTCSAKFTIYLSVTDGRDKAFDSDHNGQADTDPDSNIADDGAADGDGADGDGQMAVPDMDSGNVSGSDSSGGSSGSGGSGEEQPSSSPVVLVSGSSLSLGTVIAGETVEATIYLKNTSEKKDVQNMVVTISYDTEKFTLEGDSDTIYISSLKRGEEAELPIAFTTNRNTADGTYKIDVAMSYDDKDAVTFTSAGAIYIPVKQEMHVELSMPKISENVTAGDTMPLSFQVMNLGRSKVYNVRCEVSGYGLFSMSTAFVGDMEPGSAGTADMNVFIGMKDQSEGYTGEDSYGMTSGLVTMYYEDESGQEYSEEIAFTTSIEKAVVSVEAEGEKEEQNAGQWRIFVIFAAAAAVAAGAYAMIRRRKSV